MMRGIFNLLNTRVRENPDSLTAQQSRATYSIYQLKVNHIKLKLKAVNKFFELCKMWMIF